jgi:hypothetical protein
MSNSTPVIIDEKTGEEGKDKEKKDSTDIKNETSGGSWSTVVKRAQSHPAKTTTSKVANNGENKTHNTRFISLGRGGYSSGDGYGKWRGTSETDGKFLPTKPPRSSLAFEIKDGSKYMLPRGSCMFHLTRGGCDKRESGECNRSHDDVLLEKLIAAKLFLCKTYRCGTLFTTEGSDSPNCPPCCVNFLASRHIKSGITEEL